MNLKLNPKLDKLVDILVQLAALILVIWWCIKILSPFLVILIWGGIVAISLEPVYSSLKKLLGGRSIISSVIITGVLLSLIVLPGWLIVESLLQGIQHLKALYESGQSIIPPPGESTANWPAITKPLLNLWTEASKNIGLMMSNHTEQLKEVAVWFFKAFSNFGKGLFQLIASIIIAGVLLVYSSTIGEASTKIFGKLAGKYGVDFSEVTISTIRNVVKGILGVGLIQAGIAGVGFFMAGIPFAGFWTIVALMLSIVQIGAGPVIIPVIIYAFNTNSTLSASILTIWLCIAMVSDNVLKPILLGRNAPAPMLVIFLGAIGGFIALGFLGLFLGAVVLTLGYKLFDTWLNLPAEEGLILKEDSEK